MVPPKSAGRITFLAKAGQYTVADDILALQTQDDFLTNRGSYTVMVPADAERLTTVIEGVMEGTYAVAVVHDENGDGEFAIGENGPTEAWAVSGMPVAEPSFENSAVEVVDGEENAVTVTMAYTM